VLYDSAVILKLEMWWWQVQYSVCYGMLVVYLCFLSCNHYLRVLLMLMLRKHSESLASLQPVDNTGIPSETYSLHTLHKKSAVSTIMQHKHHTFRHEWQPWEILSSCIILQV
jgi:hypothetical protein